MTTLEEAQPMLNEAEVVDALAIEYVHNNTSIGAKKSLARVTFRILTGRAPMPSELVHLGEQLEARGNAVNQRLADRIKASIDKEVKE